MEGQGLEGGRSTDRTGDHRRHHRHDEIEEWVERLSRKRWEGGRLEGRSRWELELWWIDTRFIP